MLNMKNKKIKNNAGQNMIEYMFVLTMAIIVLLYFFAPMNPFFTAINSSIYTMENSLERAVMNVYYNIYDEPGTCVCPGPCPICP